MPPLKFKLNVIQILNFNTITNICLFAFMLNEHSIARTPLINRNNYCRLMAYKIMPNQITWQRVNEIIHTATDHQIKSLTSSIYKQRRRGSQEMVNKSSLTKVINQKALYSKNTPVPAFSWGPKRELLRCKGPTRCTVTLDPGQQPLILLK